jgi:hypothetical protein
MMPVELDLDPTAWRREPLLHPTRHGKRRFSRGPALVLLGLASLMLVSMFAQVAA